MKSCLRHWALFSILIPVAALAQDTASITGTITDATGAAVANASVVLRSGSRGIDRSTTSNGSGDYLFPALPIGAYDLSVAAKGFKRYEARGVLVQVAQKARIDVTLQVGAASEEITVQGSSVAQVETQSSDLSGTVNGKEITQLELNGRNFTQLVTLVPGVSNQTGQDEGQVGVGGSVAFSVNGGRTEYNNWELDGGDSMDNGSNTTLNVYPSIDAIAEFKVLTSNYGAQYGRNGSGTVEVETKSGTNQFHGDAYEFVRNDAFNATPYFQSAPPSYKKNDFGYTIGGPVYIPGVYNKNKQKTFFFFSQEWRRDRVPSPFPVTVVPSAAERAGNFSDLCPNASTGSMADCPINPATGTFFPSNQVPIDQNTAPALESMIPLPNGGSPGAETWTAEPTLPTNWREELLRVDENFNSKVRATFRYIHDSWDELYPTPLWTSGTSFPTIETNFKGPGVSLVTRLTATASPTLLNEFVFSYTTDHIDLVPEGAWQRPASMTWGLFQNGFGGKLPGIGFSGGIYGGIAEDAGYLPNGPYNSNPTYTYRDNVTKIIGEHNLQFGAYVVAAEKNELSAAGQSVNGFLTFDTSSPVSTGNAFADLLMGNIAEFQQQNVQLKYYNRYKIVEPYFQDDWHATSHLTLNLGLRVSLYGTYRERYHNAWNFDPSHYIVGDSGVDADGLVTGNPYNGMVQCGVTQGVPAGCMQGHLFNPAPRIGFAWDPHGDGKTAIRGGYGIFFEHTNGNEANSESLESSPPASLIPGIFNIAGPNGYETIAPQTTSTSPLAVVSVPNKAVWPYVQQWHLDVEHELARNTVATVSYVGSKGTHLTREYDLNQVHPTPLSQNPYAPGEAIGPNDCTTFTTPSGVPVTGQAAINLSIACGADPDPFRPYPGIGGITRREESASSSYNALQASLRRNVGSLQLSAAYTYSHSIDDSSSGLDLGQVNTYDLASFRASSNFDQRHVFNLGYVYDLPIFKGSGLSHKILGGWQWSGITTIQTGTPFSVASGAPVSDNAGVANTVAANYSAYPDLVGDPNAGVSQANGAINSGALGLGPLLFNPAAFVAPRGLTFGDAGRNLVNNPRRTNFDMALFKHFAIKENLAFEFRAEAFNVFNHIEWGWIGGDAGSAASNSPTANPTNTTSCYGGPDNSAGDPSCTGSATFLHAAVAHNPRILQLGAKFIF